MRPFLPLDGWISPLIMPIQNILAEIADATVEDFD
jgi:hypothetical protein